MEIQRLAGAVRRLILLRSDGPDRLITITLAEGESLPEGDLIAEATSGEETVYLIPDEVESSGQVEIEVQVSPADFEGFGTTSWDLVVAVEDAGSSSGSGDDTRYVLFEALLQFRQIEPPVVESTTITTITGSGS
jgi:hypothetical protein